ncbi:hypothetical protein J2S25_003930, partial [Mesobacillus stamsii]|nr:hypothetical protein [Mesobacillus stamsii]
MEIILQLDWSDSGILLFKEWLFLLFFESRYGPVSTMQPLN